MPVRVLIAVLIVLFVCLLFAADRTVKVIKRERRRREAGRRLAAAAAQAEAADKQRKTADQVSGALTSVMPTIHDVDTRRVD
jgi:F0F1-type ATP synthase membrane subunit b/b'